jgi:hypothetical protein
MNTEEVVGIYMYHSTCIGLRNTIYCIQYIRTLI